MHSIKLVTTTTTLIQIYMMYVLVTD